MAKNLKLSISKKQYEQAKSTVRTWEEAERDSKRREQAELSKPLVGKYFRYDKQNGDEVQRIWYALTNIRSDGILEDIEYLYQAYKNKGKISFVGTMSISQSEVLPESIQSGLYTELTQTQFLSETRFIRSALNVKAEIRD